MFMPESKFFFVHLPNVESGWVILFPHDKYLRFLRFAELSINRTKFYFCKLILLFELLVNVIPSFDGMFINMNN